MNASEIRKGVVTGILILGLFGEVGVRVTGLDEAAMKPLLYRQRADLEVHQPTSDLELLYGLRPGARASYDRGFASVARPAARPGRRTVTVNALGFRDRPRQAHKPRGVVRILCLGESNTYGSLVGDEETYPRALERRLNAVGKIHYEVWNAGISAYVLRQQAALAEKAIALYEPDVILIQHFNVGPRALLYGFPAQNYLRADPSLYLEQLHWVPLRRTLFTGFLLNQSHLSRALLILANHIHARWENRPPGKPESAPRDFEENERAIERLAQRYGGKVHFAWVIPPAGSLSARLKAVGWPAIFLGDALSPDAEPEYRLIHPPARVYRWYAEVLARELRRFGFLPEI